MIMAEPANLQPPSATTHIRNVSSDLDICESNIQGLCPRGLQCDYHHYPMPYLWQVLLQNTDWRNLTEESELIEKAFCDNHKNFIFQMPATGTDGSQFQMSVEINFVAMKAHLTCEKLPPEGMVVDVRRLSTHSYVKSVEVPGSEHSDIKYPTQWRWSWLTDTWKQFDEEQGTISQAVLETKYLYGQEVFRFEIMDKNPARLGPSQRPRTTTFLLHFNDMKLKCLNDGNTWAINRRPVFVGRAAVQEKRFVPNPSVPTCPFVPNLPDGWCPIDPQQVYEMVPLNPDSMPFHLIASEFYSSLPQNSRQVLDIFRIQNPFLWSQYVVKRTLMEKRQGRKNPEKQLFHGTNEESVVQAICRENFDWRVCGKNNTVFGKGSYFAKNAAYSDKYTVKSGGQVRWMFLARVLVGTFTKGSDLFVKPPPIDAAFPHGETYDSCVDKPDNPGIFVIFEKDQCYPEYLISYKTKS